MGKFILEYESGEHGLAIGREELFILAHFADGLDSALAEKLYYAGEKEYIYRLHKNLSLEGYDYHENEHSFWNIPDLNQVIEFIDSTLIPALNSLSDLNDDLIAHFGGWENLKGQIKTGAEFKKYFGFSSSEDRIENSADTYANIANQISTIIKDAISRNQPYYVGYND